MKLTLPKVGSWSPPRLPKIQSSIAGVNTSHWGVLYINGKVLKCRCPTWPRMNHLDICSPSYGQKKGRESTQIWRFQEECDMALESSQRELQDCFRPHPNRRSEQEVMDAQSFGSANRNNFGTPFWESWEKVPFGCSLDGELQRILYGGRWWLPSSPGHVNQVSPSCPWLVPTPRVFLNVN